jgi:hypothetical protein
MQSPIHITLPNLFSVAPSMVKDRAEITTVIFFKRFSREFFDAKRIERAHHTTVMCGAWSIVDHSRANPSHWIPDPTCDTLDTCRHGTETLEETGAHSYAQAHISTQPAQPREDPRLSLAHEDQERCRRTQPPPCGRP